MKKALIITSALVLGSSVAMADSSFRFGARASLSFRFPTSSRVVVRDHRTPTPPPAPAPAYSQYANPYDKLGRWERQPELPAIPPGLDCRNWDPTVEIDSACTAYSTGITYAPRVSDAWTLLGVRESAVGDNQFLTVNDGRAFGMLKLRAEQGRPTITKVAVRFMDNSTQVINVGGRLSTGSSLVLHLNPLAINQIVVYTAAGSHGTYSLIAH